jgi:peptidoglycan/xylan/chitin deacetylase (PgdA/CDA1 family)
MRLKEWFALRGPSYVGQRAAILLDRYGLAPAKAVARADRCVTMLAEHGCAPTFPTPGRIVERYAQFVRHLQDAGAEIAVHGYDHLDLRTYPPTGASEQLVRAAKAFERCGIQVHGFRCPYLSCNDELLDALPKGLFDYSSNQAIWWDAIPSTGASNVSTIFDTLRRFYRPRSAQDTVCVPWIRLGMVEIPVCVPDDLQLHDGLYLGPDGIAKAWNQVLNQTHLRGELFNLQFHPELASLCEQSFVAILQEARRLQPPVWIARLCDISSWWREKSGFAVAISSHTLSGLHLSFTCSERATILAKGLSVCGSEPTWDGTYYRLTTTNLDVPAEPRPFIGLPADASEHIVTFLQEQGYILDTSETAARCGMYIDAATLAKLTSEVKLIDHIETSPGPLVRYWRWPNGAKSAMCISGDLDALTLLDYASRLFVR